jgi:hypothetical protein
MKIDLTKIQTYYINLPQHIEKNEKMYKMLTELNFENFQRLDGVVYP